MPPPIVIQLRLEGMEEAKKQIQSFTKTLAGFEKQITNAVKTQANERVRSTDNETRERTRAEKEAAKAAEKAEKEKTRTAAKEARERERIAKAETRAAEREAKAKANAEIREAKRVENEMKRVQAARERKGKLIGSTIVGAAGSALGTAGRIIGAATAVGGGFGFTEALSSQLTFEKRLRSFAIAAEGDVDEGKAKEKINSLSRKSGHSRDKLLGFASGFYGLSGDAKTAMELMDFAADYSTAKDVDLEELGDMMGGLRAANPNITVDQIKKIMLDAASQGRKGAVEIGDFARLQPKLTAKASLFSDNGKSFDENVTNLSALAQVSRTATGTADEAVTATERFVNNAKIAASNGKLGIKGAKDMTPMELALAVLNKSGGDLGKMEKMGINDVAQRTVLGLKSKRDAYLEKAKSEGLTGKAAENKANQLLEEELKALTKTKTLREQTQQMEEEKNKNAATTAAKLETALNDLRVQVGEKLVKELEKATPKIAAAIPHVMKLLDYFIEFAKFAAEHPWITIMGGIGARVGKALIGELVSAKIGQLIAGQVTSSIAASGTGGVIASSLGRVIALSGPAILAYLVGKIATDSEGQYGEAGDKKMKEAQKTQAYYYEARAKGLSHEEALEYMKSPKQYGTFTAPGQGPLSNEAYDEANSPYLKPFVPSPADLPYAPLMPTQTDRIEATTIRSPNMIIENVVINSAAPRGTPIIGKN